MAATVIRNFIAKQLFKQKGAISNNKAVEFSANALENRLINLGIDPNVIRSEKELNQILAYVKQAEDQAFQQRFGDMLGGSKFDRKGEVFDMSGKKLDSSQGIIGGTQINEQTLKEGLMKTDNPFSDLVKTTDQKPKTLKEREAEVLAKLEKENKETVERIRERKRLENLEEPEDMATGGRAGYKFGIGPLINFLNKKSPMKAYTDYLDSIKTRMRAGKEAEVAGEVIPIAATGALITNQLKKKLKAMNEEQKKNIEKEAKEELRKDMEKKADGGRIGYKDGPDIKFFPRARGSQMEQEVGPGIKISERDIDYGITGLVEGDKFFGGASIDKGKVKVDVVTPEGDTIFKDTIGKDDAVNFILGMGNPKGDKFEIRTDKDLENMQFILKKSFAGGGRVGLKDGMNRRTFLKLMGGLASLPILGKFLKPAKVASKVAPVVSKSTPPAYFFELAESIKKFGRISDGPQERLKIHSMPAKDGKSELMLTEDLGTGEMQIKKISKEGDDMITEVQTMDYTPGMSQADETTQGIPRDRYDEYTEYNSRIIKDEFNEPDIIDGIKVDEIIDEVKKAPSIKKAGGGIARMLGE